MGKLTPDFKTIADFRKDNLQALKAVCREFTLLCKKLELLGGEVVGIDGSKFKANNNRKRNLNPQKLERAIREIESKIEGYLKELDEADKEDSEVKMPRAEELQEKLAQLRDRKQKYQGLAQALTQSGERQVSLTDPDSRSMPVGQATEVCDNVQTAVDAKHKLIVAHEVTNAVTDQGQLAEMALHAQATLNKGGRRITRWMEEGLLEEMAQRVKGNPHLMKRRQQICEHPFGTMKRALNSGYFLLRRLPKVQAEMSLTVLAYNMKRVLNLLGVPKLIAAVA